MKILIVNTLYAPNEVGGAEKSVQSLAESFVSLGHKVLIICLSENFNKDYAINGVNILSIKIKNKYWPYEKSSKNTYQKLLWHKKDIKNKQYDSFFEKIFLKFSPDVLFTNNLSGFSTRVWTIANQNKVKIVHTLRDYYLQCPKSTKFKNDKNCLQQCFDCKLLSKDKKRSSNKIDYVVGISDYILKNHIENGYFKGVPNRVIYNGFSELKKPALKKRKNKLIFGFIGQVKKSKGIELLLKSLSMIEEKDWNLFIAGKVEKSYLEILNNINNSKKVKYLGYVNTNDFFEKVDVLIVPSLWNEPFGRVVVESMMNEIPVYASNVGGLKELLNYDADCLFNPNINELSKLLLEIINNKENIKVKYNQNYLNNFLIKNTATHYIDIFNSLIK